MDTTLSSTGRPLNASVLSASVQQRDCGAVLASLRSTEAKRVWASYAARRLLEVGDEVGLDDRDARVLYKLSSDDVLDEGSLRFMAVDGGWRRLAVESPILSGDFPTALSALTAYFTPPLEPYTTLDDASPAIPILERVGRAYRSLYEEQVARRDGEEGRKSLNGNLDAKTLEKMTRDWTRCAEKLVRTVVKILDKYNALQNRSPTPSPQHTQRTQDDSQNSLPTPGPSSDGHGPPLPSVGDQSPPRRARKRARTAKRGEEEPPAAAAQMEQRSIDTAAETPPADEAMEVDEADGAAVLAPQSPSRRHTSRHSTDPPPASPLPRPRSAPSASPATSRKRHRDSSVQADFASPARDQPASSPSPAPAPQAAAEAADAPRASPPPPPPAPQTTALLPAATITEDADNLFAPSQPQPLPGSRSRNSDAAIRALLDQGAAKQQKRLAEERRRSMAAAPLEVVEETPSPEEGAGPRVVAPPVIVEPAPSPAEAAPAQAAAASSKKANQPPSPKPAHRQRSLTPRPIFDGVIIEGRSSVSPRMRAAKTPASSGALGPSKSAILMPPPPAKDAKLAPSSSNPDPAPAAPAPQPPTTSSSQPKPSSQHLSQGATSSSSQGGASTSSANDFPTAAQPAPLAAASSSFDAAVPAVTPHSSQNTSTSQSQDGSQPDLRYSRSKLLVPDTPSTAAAGGESQDASQEQSQSQSQSQSQGASQQLSHPLSQPGIVSSRASSTGMVVSDSQSSSVSSSAAPPPRGADLAPPSSSAEEVAVALLTSAPAVSSASGRSAAAYLAGCLGDGFDPLPNELRGESVEGEGEEREEPSEEDQLESSKGSSGAGAVDGAPAAAAQAKADEPMDDPAAAAELDEEESGESSGITYISAREAARLQRERLAEAAQALPPPPPPAAAAAVVVAAAPPVSSVSPFQTQELATQAPPPAPMASSSISAVPVRGDTTGPSETAAEKDTWEVEPFSQAMVYDDEDDEDDELDILDSDGDGGAGAEAVPAPGPVAVPPTRMNRSRSFGELDAQAEEERSWGGSGMEVDEDEDELIAQFVREDALE
ncbi:hypothetical protein JCM10207_002294 [Rhodosporidiobolus poonsookiae]